MRRPHTIAVVLAIAMALGGSGYWSFTRGNAGWEIRQAFPGAQPRDDLRIAPVPSLPQYVRIVVPAYFRADEPLGFVLEDGAQPLDLESRFSRLSHLRVNSVMFVRCQITRLGPIRAPGIPGVISFVDCDFSALPAAERARLRPYEPADQAPGQFYLAEG